MHASSDTAFLFDYGAQQRVLWVCVGISMLFHGAVLSSFSGLHEGKPTQAPVKALTAKLAPSRPAPVAPAAEVPPPPPPPQITKTQPSVPTPAKPTPAAPKAQAAPAAPSEVTAPIAPPTPQPVPAAPSAPSQQAAIAPTAPELNVRPLDAEEAGSRDQYRLALITAARRYKRYPAQAMQNGWTGRVEIRLNIGANGMIQSAAIKTSTGYALLDETALDMIKKAKPLTQIPPALRGKEFTVDVPVIFDLTAG